MQQKRSLAFCFCVFFSSCLFAQFEKGNRMVGATIGSIFFNSGKSDYSYPAPTSGFTSNQTSFGINFTPNFGWFVSDNTAAGATLTLSQSHQKTFDEDASTGNTFNRDISNRFNLGLGGFVRSYFSNSGKFYPFGQVGVNVGIGSSNSKGFFFGGGDKSTYDGKSSGDFFANAGLSLGLTKMLNRHTGLDFYLGYNFSYTKSTFKKVTQTDLGNNGTIDQTSTSEPTQKFTNHGAAIGVGFQIFLEGKKK
jgi:hypothetical protein